MHHSSAKSHTNQQSCPPRNRYDCYRYKETNITFVINVIQSIRLNEKRNRKVANNRNEDFNLRGGGSYLVECIHGKSSVHSARSFVSLPSLAQSTEGSEFFGVSPPLTFCLSNSLSTEKLIGNPGARAEFAEMSPFWSGFDMSDSTLKDIRRAMAGLLCSIALDVPLESCRGSLWQRQNVC